MRRIVLALIAVLAFFALPRAARAQETYSIDVSASQQADIEWDRVRYNGDMCVSGALPRTCTEAQLRAVPGHETDNIYANTTTGRQNFLKKIWILDRLAEVRVERGRRDTRAFCLWWAGLGQAAKDTQCAAFSLAAGCELCR
jgi:hypothetical protein